MSPNQNVPVALNYEGLPYKGDLSFNGTDTYVLKLIMNDGYVYTKSYTNTNILMPQQNWLAVGHRGSEIIDLNTIKLYSNGNLVYQPCLKIPYTESKTGSKIVGVNYRERVKDMYKQFGYAPYYTLSDTDFTLPMGEIYGMIENLRRLIIQRTSS